MTPDLRQAHVYLGVIGREDLQSEALHKVRKAAGAISAKLSRRVILKNSPNLHFSLDNSIERGVRVLNIIEKIDRNDSARRTSISQMPLLVPAMDEARNQPTNVRLRAPDVTLHQH